ncbi:MAG: hypothetical protein COA42_03080 [Alteromonadaceae bacterium]|nr:MAG: hypothetical protein COA42_03080 [Alteromonadaceae bacterium]
MHLMTRKIKFISIIISTATILSLSSSAFSEKRIELDKTVIKGNTELPKMLYIIPWQKVSNDKKAPQRLVLHSLFGDLFDPVTPLAPEQQVLSH